MLKEIIAVDDTKEALARIKGVAANQPDVAIRTFDNEAAALEMIGKFRKGQTLPIFFVDLNLKGGEDPEGAGHRILKAIRRKRALKLTPVIIVSNSDDSDSITESYKFGANAYHIKQGKAELQAVIRYWLDNDQDESVLNKRSA